MSAVAAVVAAGVTDGWRAWAAAIAAGAGVVGGRAREAGGRRAERDAVAAQEEGLTCAGGVGVGVRGEGGGWARFVCDFCRC